MTTSQNALKETLREPLSDDMKAIIFDKVQGERWRKCVGVAGGMTENSTEPRLSDQQKERIRQWLMEQ